MDITDEISSGGVRWFFPVAPESPEYFELYNAVGANDLITVEKAISDGLGLNFFFHRQHSWMTLLHVACGEGYIDMVVYLLDHGAVLDCWGYSDYGLCTPLYEAARGCFDNIVILLLDRGAKIKASATRGASIISYLLAASDNKTLTVARLRMISLLLDRKYYPCWRYDSHILNLALLSQAAEFDSRTTIFESLLKHGRHILDSRVKILFLQAATESNKVDLIEYVRRYYTPVRARELVAASDSLSDMRVLLSHTTDTVMAENDALHEACVKGNFEVVALLLSYGFDVDKYHSDMDGLTPLALVCAQMEPNIEMVDALLRYGADVQNADIQVLQPDSTYPFTGTSALHYAAIGSDEAVVRSLLDAGADINARDFAGQPPLTWFVEFLFKELVGPLFEYPPHTPLTPQTPQKRQKRLSVLRLMIREGAATDHVVGRETLLHFVARNSNCTTPLEMVTESFTLFIGAGANFHALASDGLTALDLFRRSGRADIADALVKHFPDEQL